MNSLSKLFCVIAPALAFNSGRPGSEAKQSDSEGVILRSRATKDHILEVLDPSACWPQDDASRQDCFVTSFLAMTPSVSSLLLGLMCLFSAAVISAQPVEMPNTETQVELVSELEQVQPGQTFWVAVRFIMGDGWHIYWKNPGDSGAPPKITWGLPDGVKAGDIQWPFPHRIDYDGLTSYGYGRKVFFLSQIALPKNLPVGEMLTLNARIDALVCKEICVPGEADISLQLPVTNDSIIQQTQWAGRFDKTRREFPIHSKDWNISATREGNKINVSIKPSTLIKHSITDIEFFPDQADVIDHVAKQSLSKIKDGYILMIEKSPFRTDSVTTLQGLLVAREGWRGLNSERALQIDVPVLDHKAVALQIQTSSMSLALACLFAFIGGLILNLMPCVLPVLSIKVLQLIQHLDDPVKSRLNSLVFALGIITSFWVLAIIVIVFKTAGMYVGWGFQFQSPAFVAFMASLLFLLGLNLFGVFELAVSITSKAGQLQSSFSYSSAFASGVLATVVATPCTAPFMGTALGYALAQPNHVALLVFTCLGAGLAFPYVVITNFPVLLKWIPKPGRWMLTLKSILGFIMMACVIWLLWVLTMQSASSTVFRVAIGLLIITGGAWLLGRAAGYESNTNFSRWLRIISILIIVAGFGFNVVQAKRAPILAKHFEDKSSAIPWQDYSAQLIEELQRDHKKIFINFTASWCISCKVNERLVFKNERVIQRIKDLDIVMVKADWTNHDDEITKALARFGKNSIPLYVLFSSDSAKSPIILPEIITPGIVLKALDDL